MEIVVSFSQRLKEIMNRKGVRACEVTAATGISPSQMSHYLKGDYDPKQITLVKLSRFFEVNELWLTGYDVDEKRYPSTINGIKKEIVEYLENLNEQELSRIKNFIKEYFIDD